MNNKTQSSIEFLSLISFLFLISLGFIAAAGSQLKDYSDSRKSIIVKDFAISIQKELELASIVKNGYEREISLPEQIDSTINYEISVNKSTLVVDTDYLDSSFIIPPIVGELKKGTNVIRKLNNSVIIENG